jgi:hypothetical protein
MIETTQNVSVEQLITLAIEHWRLSTELADHNSPAVRYALRKMEAFLKSCEIETRVLDGLPYDTGLAAAVVDKLDDVSPETEPVVIIQTVCPMVLHRGNVVRGAEVVIARKPG